MPGMIRCVPWRARIQAALRLSTAWGAARPCDQISKREQLDAQGATTAATSTAAVIAAASRWRLRDDDRRRARVPGKWFDGVGRDARWRHRDVSEILGA